MSHTVRDFLRDKFSFSKLTCFSSCPRKFFYRYVMGMKEPPNEALVMGRATHAGQEEYNREYATGRRLSRAQVLDKAASVYEEHGGQVVDRFVEDHEIHLRKYEESGEWARVCPVPGTVEAPFQVDLAVTHDPEAEEPRGALIEGFVDCVSQDEETGELTVVDYKTVGRPVSQKESDASIQGALYDLGNNASKHKFVSFVKRGKQRPTTRVVESEVRSTALQKLLQFVADTIAGIRRSIKSDDFPKCDPKCHWCDEGVCSFYHLCYPKKNPELTKYVQVGEVRPAGTVEMPEWRKNR